MNGSQWNTEILKKMRVKTYFSCRTVTITPRHPSLVEEFCAKVPAFQFLRMVCRPNTADYIEPHINSLAHTPAKSTHLTSPHPFLPLCSSSFLPSFPLPSLSVFLLLFPPPPSSFPLPSLSVFLLLSSPLPVFLLLFPPPPSSFLPSFPLPSLSLSVPPPPLFPPSSPSSLFLLLLSSLLPPPPLFSPFASKNSKCKRKILLQSQAVCPL